MPARSYHVMENHSKYNPDHKTVCQKCAKEVRTSYAKIHEANCNGIPYESAIKDFVFIPHPTDRFLCPEPGCEYRNEKSGRVKHHFTSKHIRAPCQICNIVYSIVNMDVHMLTVHKVVTPRAKRFACQQCPATFVYRAQLVNHMDLEHIKEPKYVCDQCGMRFIGRRLLYNHRDSAHRRIVRRNPCNMCGKNFRSVRPFKEHMLQEHGVRVE